MSRHSDDIALDALAKRTNPKPELGTCDSLHGDVDHIRITEGLQPCVNWQPLPSPQEQGRAHNDYESDQYGTLKCRVCGLAETDRPKFCSGTPSASEGGRDELQELKYAFQGLINTARRYKNGFMGAAVLEEYLVEAERLIGAKR